MRLTVLGAVSVLDASAAAPSGEIARRVLAVLAAEANRPVLPARLADLVWPRDESPQDNRLQAHVSRWRKALGRHRIGYGTAGYTLHLATEELDALEFETLAAAGTAARGRGDLGAGIDLAQHALSLWRGPAFADLADHDCVHTRRVELETARDRVRLDLLEMLCETGAYDRVVPEAAVALQADPWNESVHRALARAHYGRGDQVAALAVLTDLEARLRGDLGLDLGPASQLLRGQILRHEPVTERRAGPASPAPATGTVPGWAERLAALPLTTQRAVRAAALAGPVWDTAQIAQVVGVDGPVLADALAPALAAGIAVRDEGGIRFSDPGVREQVAALISPGEALALHRGLGESLLRRRGEPALLRRAADHVAAAAPLDPATAGLAVELDQELAHASMVQAQYADAVRHARRALTSATNVTDDPVRIDRARLWLTLGEALQAAGDLDAAMAAHAAAAETPGAGAQITISSALGYEECSVRARRPRTGARDRSVRLLTQALAAAGIEDPRRVEVLAALAQALSFSGLDARAGRMVEDAVTGARDSSDPETLARTLLRGVAAHDPVTGAAARFDLAREAATVARAAEADELELDALAAWVPELMRHDRLLETEEVVARVEHLAQTQGNLVHPHQVPMWRAALALAAGRHDEAEVLIEDFRVAGERAGYADTARIHGFQSILLALGRRTPERAAAVLARFDDDRGFEPWRATALAVAHARGDRATAVRILAPWSARRFALARPFAGIRTFCACLVAEAVAEYGDEAARGRLAALVRPGVGQRQVLGAGAAVLGDASEALGVLLAVPS
ncbi:BTAD domain-containing putative transcriptional regulator [Nocardioides sp. LHD-245]|uniref:BTAD domain-containing putative transcriptional regulator n=1 Tax=Nocardioides sp. LHD-245 TaxID=3051387 RepID=UPI0027DF9CFE|nr:BTAD domain-containing putative transcriptional regulator [Nocardioides sp. LHD-245]